MKLDPETYLDLAERCTTLAERAFRNPYATADAYYWLDHAERMDEACNRALDTLGGAHA